MTKEDAVKEIASHIQAIQDHMNAVENLADEYNIEVTLPNVESPEGGDISYRGKMAYINRYYEGDLKYAYADHIGVDEEELLEEFNGNQEALDTTVKEWFETFEPYCGSGWKDWNSSSAYC